MEDVIFYNYSDEDFRWNWDSKPYFFAARSVTRDMIKSGDGVSREALTPAMAEMFAIHLADREMDKKGIDPGRLDDKARFVQKALVLPEVEDEDVVTPAVEEKPKEEKPVCEECGFEAKTKTGLARHATTHKKEEFSEEPVE